MKFILWQYDTWQSKAEQTNDLHFFFQVEILIVSSLIKWDEK